MLGLFVIGLIISGYRDIYIENHGTSEGFAEKAVIWCVSIYLAVAIAHISIIPHILGLIIFLSYQAYKGYKEVE